MNINFRYGYRRKEMKQYLKLLRVKQYLKNILIFVPLFFSQQFFESGKLLRGIIGFISFCLISSAVYIINDMKDVEKDRQHPTKKNRPLANRTISVKNAKIVLGICILASIGINILLGSIAGICLVLVYLVINIAYSFGLKNYPIIDIVILSSGFLIRVMYGSAITNITISSWLYLMIISAALYLVLGKRRNEIKKQGNTGETRNVLKYYNYDFLDKNMYVCLGLTDGFYALWAMSKADTYLFWTVPLVIILLMKYSLDIEGDSDGDPIEVIYKDKILIGIFALYAIVLVLILYVF